MLAVGFFITVNLIFKKLALVEGLANLLLVLKIGKKSSARQDRESNSQLCLPQCEWRGATQPTTPL